MRGFERWETPDALERARVSPARLWLAVKQAPVAVHHDPVWETRSPSSLVGTELC